MTVGKWVRFYRIVFSTLYISSIASFICPTLFAAPSTEPSLQKVYNSTSYYEEDGLASNMVDEMGQAEDGIMWFVTRNGISTFDGLRWHTFDEKPVSPSNNRVNLLPIPEGGMLLSCIAKKNLQIKYYDTKAWHTVSNPVPLKEEVDLNFSRHTSYYIQAKNEYQIAFTYEQQLHLYQSSDSLWESFTIPAEINWKEIKWVQFFDGEIFILGSQGLSSFNLQSREFNSLPIPELKGELLLTATTSLDGNTLYLLGNTFLGRYSRKEFKIIARDIFEPAPLNIGISNIHADRYGRVIFNYNSALFMYKEGSDEVDSFKLDDAESTLIPSDIFEDNEGNTWFTTLRGVHKVNTFLFYNFKKSSGLFSTEVSTLLPFNNYKSMLLGGNDGISIINKNSRIAHSTDFHSNSVSLNRVLDALETPDGKLYVAANHLGLGSLLPGGNIKWYPHPENHFITTIAFQNDSLIAATHRGQLLYFNNGTFETLWQNQEGEDFLYIRKILTAENGRILLTNKGIYQFSGNKVSRIRGRNSEQENIYSYLSYKGRTLLGSMQGLCELKNDSIVPVQIPTLEINRPVYALLEDQKGRLWAGTDKGIYRYQEGEYLNLNLNHGLSGKEINRNAFHLMPDGKIWIGTDQGISVYNPADDYRRETIPKIRLTSGRTTGEMRFDPMEENKLPYKQNTLEFLFRTITYSLPATLELRYRLDGLEEDWVNSRNHLRNSVRYTNLPPGDYSFMVQARYPDGNWSETAISKPITILKPFYNEWWFLLLSVGAICSAGYFAHIFITQKENAKKLEQAIEEKKAQIQESELRFRAIWEANDTGTLLVNPVGKIMMVNPAFCKLLNISANKAVGAFTGSLLPDELFSTERLMEIHKGKDQVQDQVVLELSHQTFHLQISFSFIDQLKQHDSLMVISCKDITKQKQAETNNARLTKELIRHNSALLRKEDELANYNHELLQQREELEQALRIVEERNYELDQFVYKTSHDLRAPIASAMGLVNIIKMDSDHTRWPHYVDLIGKSLVKQDNFIRAMLSFSKSTRSQNKAEPIGFRELIKLCLQELQYLSGFSNIKKEIEVKGEQELFYSDRMKLYIILSNILSNSIKYHDPNKESFLHILISLNEDSADMLIKDNGIGIEEKYTRHIFNMFYRATEKSDGSGLGLYIVKQTVEKLGGTIQVNSEAGAGTSFHVHIPNQYAPFGKDFLMDSQDKPSIS